MTTSVQSIPGMLGGGLLSQDNGSSNVTSATANALNINAFLQMFVTQLQYQDPTNPLESYEMAAQLAQFSTVEKLTQATSLLNTIQSYSAGINNAGIASMVGRNVTALKSTIDVKADSVSTLDYRIETPAAVTVTIKDSLGNVVRTESKGPQAAGQYKFEWDGKDQSGSRVSEGEYSCEVTAMNQAGETSKVRTTIQGQVYSCSLEAGNPTFLLSGPDGIRIPVSDVFEVVNQAAASA